MAAAERLFTVVFTGRTGRLRWAPPNDRNLFERLRRMFPFAGAERLAQLMCDQRTVLARGTPEEEAQRIARVLRKHELGCQLVEESDPAAEAERSALRELRLAPYLLKRPRPARRHRPVLRLLRTPGAGVEDRLTPAGRAGLLAGAILLAALVALEGSSAARRYAGAWSFAGDGAEIPSLCVVDELPELFGRAPRYALECTASSALGRYRLAVRCDAGGGVRIGLAAFDLDGRPRPLPRPADGPSRPVLYTRSGDTAHGVALLPGQEPNAGVLGIDGAAAAEMLGAPAAGFSEVFPGESVAFDFDAAAWYVHYFLRGCGMAGSRPGG
ncbi:MAG: hypothetical protein HYV18_00545 [Gammaproteobacteria bacterium]|nr:hypothetical protein [Gammaproteobacteria bacterium]